MLNDCYKNKALSLQSENRKTFQEKTIHPND